MYFIKPRPNKSLDSFPNFTKILLNYMINRKNHLEGYLEAILSIATFLMVTGLLRLPLIKFVFIIHNNYSTSLSRT